MVAACGVPVPMISGRGLGHTAALWQTRIHPGFRTDLSISEYKQVIREIGVVMIGQTKEIAPADKKMYPGDVTATVECIPLIAGSIMSKKLAEGIDVLVLDVKTGRGAFMQTWTSVGIGDNTCRNRQWIWKRDHRFHNEYEPAARCCHRNWLEVVESVECLRGAVGNNDASSDLMEVTYMLSARWCISVKKQIDEEGIDKCRKTIEDGSAYHKLLDLIHAQGGILKQLKIWKIPAAKFAMEVKSSEKGFIKEIDSFELGLTSISLGAGREKIDDIIDMKAGIL